MWPILTFSFCVPVITVAISAALRNRWLDLDFYFASTVCNVHEMPDKNKQLASALLPHNRISLWQPAKHDGMGACTQRDQHDRGDWWEGYEQIEIYMQWSMMGRVWDLHGSGAWWERYVEIEIYMAVEHDGKGMEQMEEPDGKGMSR